jgi:hypothetical protein
MLEYIIIALLYLCGAILMAAYINLSLETDNLSGRPFRIVLGVVIWPLILVIFCFIAVFDMVRKHVA